MELLQVVDSAISGFQSTSEAYSMHNNAFNYLDSPSTTSATTYKVQMITETSGHTAYVNRTGSDLDENQPYSVRTSSTITAIEIAG